jgi:hypothetical protein
VFFTYSPKKRPVSAGSNNIIEDSIHMNEVTGMTVEQLVTHLKKTKRRGLYNEYAHIKMEKISTFVVYIGKTLLYLL